MSNKLLASIFIGLAFPAIVAIGLSVNAAGGILFANKPTGYSEPYTFFVATTTSATSTNKSDVNDIGYFTIAGAKRVDMYLSHGGVATSSTGTSTIRVQVSPNGQEWYDFGKLMQATSTNLQPTVQLVGATNTVVLSLDLRNDAFKGVRCIVLEGTNTGASGDGEHSCAAYAEY